MDFTECLAVLEHHREQQHSAGHDGHREEDGSRCRAAGSKTVGKNSGEEVARLGYLHLFILGGNIIGLAAALCSLYTKEHNNNDPTSST